MLLVEAFGVKHAPSHVSCRFTGDVRVHPAFQCTPCHCLNFEKSKRNSAARLQQTLKAQSAAAGCIWQGCCRYNEIRSEFDQEAATLDMPPHDSIKISRISLIAQVSLADRA